MFIIISSNSFEHFDVYYINKNRINIVVKFLFKLSNYKENLQKKIITKKRCLLFIFVKLVLNEMLLVLETF